MTNASDRAAKLERMRKRLNPDAEMYIMVGGEPEKIGLPSSLQWRHMRSIYPLLDPLFGGKGEAPEGLDGSDVYRQMQVDIVGLCLALQHVKENSRGLEDGDVEGFSEMAAAMVPNELEDAWLAIYLESKPEVKAHFAAAEAEAAKTTSGNLGDGADKPKPKKPRAPRKPKPKASSSSTSAVPSS